MKDFKNDITNSLNALHSGGLILYPTDTIWGIGCDATNPAAVSDIYLLKKREEKKSMIILVADAPDINNYVMDPAKKLIDFIVKQTSPTTAIFKNAFNLPAQLINADGSIAIRIVRDDFCQQLIKELGMPLVSTSANVSGHDYPEFFKEISEEIRSGVDYIVQHRQDEMEAHQLSSIVKLNSDGEIEKVR